MVCGLRSGSDAKGLARTRDPLNVLRPYRRGAQAPKRNRPAALGRPAGVREVFDFAQPLGGVNESAAFFAAS